MDAGQCNLERFVKAQGNNCMATLENILAVVSAGKK